MRDCAHVRFLTLMKRPPKSLVEAAVRAGLGGDNPSLSKVADILQCSRPSLYKWLDQYGLDRLAGVRHAEPDGVNRKGEPYRASGAQGQSTVNPGRRDGTTLQLVNTATQREARVTITSKARGSVWKRVRKVAIDLERPLADLVEEGLEMMLEKRELEAQKAAQR